jgi:hypothetical protein
MLGKSSLILRALFTALALGSLVACTFEGNLDEDEDTKSANLRGANDETKDDEDDETLVATAVDGGTGTDASAVVRDGGAFGGDASVVYTDGGRPRADGGWWGTHDGGSYGGDASVGRDGGSFGGDASADGGGGF